MRLPRIFHSKIFLIIVLLLLVSVGSLEWKQWQERRDINQEIESLMAQEQDLQQKNRDLESSLSFLTSEEYRDKIARQQLNMKKDGEIVVNFPSQTGESVETTESTTEKSNPSKWWDYFFSIN